MHESKGYAQPAVCRGPCGGGQPNFVGHPNYADVPRTRGVSHMERNDAVGLYTAASWARATKPVPELVGDERFRVVGDPPETAGDHALLLGEDVVGDGLLDKSFGSGVAAFGAI